MTYLKYIAVLTTGIVLVNAFINYNQKNVFDELCKKVYKNINDDKYEERCKEIYKTLL